MAHDAMPGESAGHAVRRFLALRTALRRAALGGVLLSALLAAPAMAGSLYRCVGSAGETVLSSSTAGYAGCKRIAGFAPARPRAAVRAPGAVVSPPPASPATAARGSNDGSAAGAMPSFAGVTGSAVTSASLVAARGVQAVPTEPNTEVTAVPAVASAPASPRGRWAYRESTSDELAAVAVPEPAKGTRVLRGAVYRITRADGGVEYTNIPPGGAGKGREVKMLFTYIATCAACDVHSRIDWNSVALNLSSYGDAIRSASIEYGVSEALLRAVIHAESAFNPRALSVAGAQGLMQLVPGTARDMGVLDAFDAGQNIRGGARYLALLLKNFNGNERLAAAAYNAGPGAVQKYGGVPPYDETQVYVERVGVLRKRYGETLKGRPGTGVPLADRGT